MVLLGVHIQRLLLQHFRTWQRDQCDYYYHLNSSKDNNIPVTNIIIKFISTPGRGILCWMLVVEAPAVVPLRFEIVISLTRNFKSGQVLLETIVYWSCSVHPSSCIIHLLGTIMITFWPFWVPPGIWIIWLLWFWLACWMCTWSKIRWWRWGFYEKLIKSPAEVVPGSQLGQVGRSGFGRQLFGLFGAESGQWSLAEIEQNWISIPSSVKSHLLLKYYMLPCLSPHTAEHLRKE